MRRNAFKSDSRGPRRRVCGWVQFPPFVFLLLIEREIYLWDYTYLGNEEKGRCAQPHTAIFLDPPRQRGGVLLEWTLPSRGESTAEPFSTYLL